MLSYKIFNPEAYPGGEAFGASAPGSLKGRKNKKKKERKGKEKERKKEEKR